jgi:glycosyltransferase involved in cell wall biosynthesis
MKIIQTCRYYAPYMTGAGLHVQQISQRLSARNHKVKVLTINHGDAPAQEEIGGVFVHRYPSHLWNLSLFSSLLRSDYDLIHAHAIWSHVYISLLAAKIKHKPIVITPHGTWLFVHRTRKLNFFYHYLWPMVTRYASFLVASGDDELKQLIAMGEISHKAKRFFSYSVDISKFKKSDGAYLRNKFQNFSKFVLFVGNISKHKGVDIVLRGVLPILERHPKTLFLFLGIGPELEELKHLAKELGVISHVRFLGRVPNEDLPKFYSSADVFVGPSVYEPFGIVYLEAMACETPVIATNVGGPLEIVRDGETGFLVNVGDVEGVADKINTLLGDDALRIEMGRQARQDVIARYSWEKTTDHLEALYQRLVVER